MTVFYRQAEIPASSNAALRNAREAREYGRGSLRLAFCDTCGFIANIDFDPEVAAVAGGYEESQAASAVFRTFAEELASRWVERYDLRGGSITEIGCGKGEFLALISDLADARGVGIDPAFVPGRSGAESSGRLTFVREPFSADHAAVIGDAVVCRHTLEHIHDVKEFLSTLRQAIGDRASTLLFELPDSMRILREGAFWDVYYEHCSYFTRGSLARAFRGAGFRLLDLRLEYNGQYIIAEARPNGGTGAPAEDEESVDDIRAAVADFADRTSKTIEYWRERLDGELRGGRRSVLWGAGSKAIGFLTSMDGAGAVEYVVDINPHKQGTFLPVSAQEVVAPSVLREHRPGLVVVMNPVYTDEIKEELRRLGVGADVVAVGGD